MRKILITLLLLTGLGFSGWTVAEDTKSVETIVEITETETADAPAEAPAAAEKPTLNSGDTAWMLTSTALVLFMTIPGLSLFYAGMVRTKNVLSVLMQCFAITSMVTVLWTVYGYSVAFDTTGMEKGIVNLHSFVGGFSKVFLGSVARDSLTLAIPETVFFCFQMTFAIITPALIVGAFAERMKFSALLLFMAIWFTVVFWISPAVRWFISMPVSPALSPPWSWASAAAIRRRRCPRTIWYSPSWARPCCGSAGSGSTPAARSQRMAVPAWRWRSRRLPRR
jgi:hypothetical protein